MEQIQAKLVNKGFEGEPENIVLQAIESLQLFDFSQIKFVNENGDVREVVLNDNDLSQTEIQTILNNTHIANITFDENNDVTLYF
jgi:hypothetical protein